MSIKVGITLSGGGAKGAYQVGMIKALAELDIEVEAISGASIGSLNGGIIASSSDINTAANNLKLVWQELANQEVLQANPSSYFLFLQKAGLNFIGSDISEFLGKIGIDLAQTLNEKGLLKDDPLNEMMNKFLCKSSLNSGIPLFVSVYESEGFTHDILKAIPSLLHLNEGKHSEFFHIQSLPVDEQREALLASAAIPFLFKPKKINGQIYSDGGLGGWKNSQGNTPVTPLVEFGCNLIIVSHLGDGSLWNRNHFPDTTFIEVRPQSCISRERGLFSGAKDVLGFNAGNINSWIDQGYRDTMHCVGRVTDALSSRRKFEQSKNDLIESGNRNKKADEALQDAIELLK